MEDLTRLFSKVQSSATASDEENRVGDVWQYMYENRIHVAVHALNDTGESTDINNLPDPAEIESVEVVFTKGDTVISFQWDPVDNENIFILFREK